MSDFTWQSPEGKKALEDCLNACARGLDALGKKEKLSSYEQAIMLNMAQLHSLCAGYLALTIKKPMLWG